MRLTFALVTTVMLSACGAGSVGGDPDLSTTSTEALATTTPSTTSSDRPPDLRVVAPSGSELVLAPFGYCWFEDGQGVCADGVPPDPLPSIALGEVGGLSLFFPLEWSMEVTVLPSDDQCEGVWSLEAEPDGTPIEALGEAGTLRLDVFARGEQGDAAWSFEVVSSSDRPVPPPYAQAYWQPSGDALREGVSLSIVIGNLAPRSESVTGSVTVTAQNGATHEFPLSPTIDPDCPGSTVLLEGPGGFTGDVLALGPEPYDLAITVELDGHVVAADPLRWPDGFPPDSNQSERLAVSAFSS